MSDAAAAATKVPPFRAVDLISLLVILFAGHRVLRPGEPDAH